MLEAAKILHAFVQRILAGVAEGRVAEVVRERDGLGQVLVQFQRPGDGATDLGDLDGMRQARAVEVALVVHEHLGLVLQAPKRRAVDDAVAVALVFGAVRRARLGILPAA